jgi:hypothetical protein
VSPLVRRHLSTMKLRNACFVIGIILLVIVGTLAAANIRPIHDQCPWQFPKILSCLLSARETLAAGLIGAGGAIFAAWLAWTAVREQIAVDRRQIAESKAAQKRGVVSQLEYNIGSLRSAQDDLQDLVKKFPDQKDPRQYIFATTLAGMDRVYSFRLVQRAQSAPDGLGEQVSNSLNQLRVMAGNINHEIQGLSADQQIGVLTSWDTSVRDRVMDISNVLDKVNHAISEYDRRLAPARQDLADAEKSLGLKPN